MPFHTCDETTPALEDAILEGCCFALFSRHGPEALPSNVRRSDRHSLGESLLFLVLRPAARPLVSGCSRSATYRVPPRCPSHICSVPRQGWASKNESRAVHSDSRRVTERNKQLKRHAMTTRRCQSRTSRTILCVNTKDYMRCVRRNSAASEL
jgi:hypothetical protein